MNHDERRNQNQGSDGVRSMSETVDEPQSIAREDKEVNHREQDKLDREIDPPERKVSFRLAPQATDRFPLRQVDARQDPHLPERHHQQPLSDRIPLFWIVNDTKRSDFSRSISGDGLVPLF